MFGFDQFTQILRQAADFPPAFGVNHHAVNPFRLVNKVFFCKYIQWLPSQICLALGANLFGETHENGWGLGAALAAGKPGVCHE